MKTDLDLTNAAHLRRDMGHAEAVKMAAFGEKLRRSPRVPPPPCKFAVHEMMVRCTHCGIGAVAQKMKDPAEQALEFAVVKKNLSEQSCEAYRRAEAFAASRLRADTAAWNRETAPGTREANKFDTALWLVILVIAIILLAFSLGGYINGPR